jgi:hypothetical protein
MANEFKHKDPGAEITSAEYIAACGDGHIFACQATGDILYASSATVLKNLGKGAANTVLHMGGSCIPAWTASPSVTDLTIGGGCITLSAATDIDLLDNNASALSFDASGKAGIIDIVTTNCSEGVTMSGTLGVTGVMTATGGIELSHACQNTLTASGGVLSIQCNVVYSAGGTDVAVADGGTGASTLTDGGVLLGSGTSAVTAMAVLADSEMIVGDGTTDPVAESGATLRTSIGVGTGDSPQFTGIELGHASDTTIARSGSGDITIEGNAVYRAGGTDVPVADGGTGASTLTCGGVLLGSGTGAITAMSVLAAGALIKGDGSGDPGALARGSANQVLTTKCCDVSWEDAAAGGSLTLIGTQVASCDAALTQTGLDSTYDTYMVVMSDLRVTCDSAGLSFRVGDSGGIDSASGNYSYHIMNLAAASTSYAAGASASANKIALAETGIGNAAGEGWGGVLWIHRPGDGYTRPLISGHYTQIDASSNSQGGIIFGQREAVITLDRVSLIGCLVTGRMTTFGLKHA